MRAGTAAAYLDEPSVRSFLRKVDAGVYSQPVRSPGSSPKWHRSKLDFDVARRHGLRCHEPYDLQDLTELI